MGRKAPRKRLARRVMACPRVPRTHPNVSRRSAHPSIRVSEAKEQTLGAENAPREREGLFDIVRYDYRTGSASGRPREGGDPYPRSLVMGPGSPPASRASAGTTI